MKPTKQGRKLTNAEGHAAIDAFRASHSTAAKGGKKVGAQLRYLNDMLCLESERQDPSHTPVFVLPADPASVEKMREQVAQSIFEYNYPAQDWREQTATLKEIYQAMADRQLKALNLTTK